MMLTQTRYADIARCFSSGTRDMCGMKWTTRPSSRTLVLPIKRIEGSAPKSALKIGPKNRKIGPKIGSKKLSPQERLDMIIAIIKNNPRITRKNIEDMLDVGHTTIQNDLRILKEQYGVHYEGSSKTGEWVIGK